MSMWEKTLKKVYGNLASVTTVEGEWKTGKTDFALHLIEECRRLGIISEAAANIQCYQDKECTIPDNETVKYLDNFMELRAWLFSGKRKMLVFDEAITSTPSRRAMSATNTEWLKFIPELSKGRCHLVVITQEEEITDKVFFHPTFHTASWEKIAVSRKHPQFRKMVKITGKYFPKAIIFKNLPPTKIIFDPYRSATWKMESSVENLNDDDIRIAVEYAKGLSSEDIIKKYPFIHTRKDVSLRLKRAIKKLTECKSAYNSVGYTPDKKPTQVDA